MKDNTIHISLDVDDLLTMVSVPEAQQEQDRDLLRSRKKLQEIQGDLRRHIHGLQIK